MAAPHVFVSYSIVDAKGKKSTTQINFPTTAVDGNHVDVLVAFAQTTAPLIDAIIRGKIVDAGIGIKVDLTGEVLKASPLPTSDREEGAKFIWNTALATLPRFRLPTFDEDFILPGTEAVDLADPDVDAFHDRIIAGHTVGIFNVQPSDDHGEDITSIASARESFGNSRP